MQTKTLCEPYRQTEKRPCGTGMEIVGHHVADNDQRLDALEVGLRQEVGEAEAFEAAADCKKLAAWPSSRFLMSPTVDLRSQLPLLSRHATTLSATGKYCEHQC